MLYIKKDIPFGLIPNVEINALTGIASYGISEGAIVLYVYLLSLENGSIIKDTEIINALDIKQRTLSNRRAELKEAGLLLITRVTPQVSELFIGYKDKTALEVKAMWDAYDED